MKHQLTLLALAASTATVTAIPQGEVQDITGLFSQHALPDRELHC